MKTNAEEYIPIRKAARQLHTSPDRAREFIEAGKVVAFVVGGTKKQPRLAVRVSELRAAIVAQGLAPLPMRRQMRSHRAEYEFKNAPAFLQQAWTKYAPFVRVEPCVYFVVWRGIITYVGCTNDLHRRLAQHFKNGAGRQISEAFFIEAKNPAAISRYEAAAIQFLTPCRNTMRGISLPSDSQEAIFRELCGCGGL